ncbi:unnamed protein product [Gongylonema pulchrum]|uniref:BPI2 domain-containing protein n=1 Tax=Gongylonema pulchrum TaxID=637853 RepID=A0A183EFN3_9BILA|nr:unnamed protein product [Gongylonema pulchrum]
MVVESSNDALSDKSSGANENSLRKKVGMLVRVTRRMINYCARVWLSSRKTDAFFFQELKLSFQKELENEQLPEFSRILMRLNVSVLSPRIHNVIIPRSTYKVLPNDTVEMRMRGGSVQLQGFYRAVYRTIREGELAANLSSFAINLKFKISTTFAGKLLLENVVCDAEVRVVDVQLVPKLHDLVDEGLRTAFDEHTSVSHIINRAFCICAIFLQYKDIMEHLLIDTTISYGISLMEDYFDFPLVGTPTISKMNTTSLHPLVVCSLSSDFHDVPYLQKLPEDKSKMVYIYITEFVLNSFLKKLDTFGNTALLLSAVPEFDGLLQLNCSENLECMGDFLQDAEPYQFDSGTMLLKMRSPAVATLRDGFMLLDLNLKVTVSYVQDGVDVNVLEFDWLLTVRINNAFLNEHLVSKVLFF